MENIKWHPAFEVGNSKIDSQHEIFVNLIRKLIFAINKGKGAHYLSRLVLELEKYAEFHFVSEENLMIDIDYPEIVAHEKQHLELLGKFNLVLNYVELGKEKHEDFVTFLIEWFKSHTVNEDMKLAHFCSIEKKK